nr:MAG TPA: hypothetical protein [Caudoviricetes sp.]
MAIVHIDSRLKSIQEELGLYNKKNQIDLI